MKQPKNNKMIIQEIDAHTKKFCQADDRWSWWILLTTLFFYGLPVFLYQYLPAWFYIFCRSYVTVRLFMIFHDCCHSSFFQSQKWNSRVGKKARVKYITKIKYLKLGIFTGGLVITPFESFRDRHLYHHKISG